jgi:hypothetical protein
MTIERRDVTFNSGDSFVTGWFFLPEGGTLASGYPLWRWHRALAG